MTKTYKYKKRLHTKNFTMVSSKAIVSIDYDDAKKILEIEFIDDKIYHYLTIDKRIWKHILSIINNKESLGTYVNSEFKKMVEINKYDYFEI